MSEHGNMNIDMQNKSYGAFIQLFKYSTIAVVVLLILMAIFLV